MSLFKQLWIAIVVVMTVAFGGSLVLSVLSARHYLEQQLQVKNIDNATSLALSLTQLDKDLVTMDLQVSAQFDAGHYRFIRITSAKGETLVEKVYRGKPTGAPQWFAALIPIEAEPGRAQIQDGWKQFGTLTLASHEQFAYKSLWEGTLELLTWFITGGLIAGVIGSLIVRYIARPLKDVVAQADAITQRRFLTVKEPRTPELRAVTHAMNDMVGRLQIMFAEESSRLESLRLRVNHDAVTRLATREYFMSNLHDILEGEEFGSVGSLVMVRLIHLNQLNAQLGHQRADELLRELGLVLYNSGNGRPGQRAGRVKGGEFAVVCPGYSSPTQAAQDIHSRILRDWLPNWEADFPELFHLGAVRYQRHQSMSDLLTRADHALAQAQAHGSNNWHAIEDNDTHLNMPAGEWRVLLKDAIEKDRFSLVFFPVMDIASPKVLHQEGMLRLRLNETDPPLSAGDFMPMAASLHLTAPIDLRVVQLAIAQLKRASGHVAVNLSSEIMASFSFRNQLLQLLQSEPEHCKRLCFEVDEHGVFREFEAFCDLTRSLKGLGCRVGIEYFRDRFADSDKLAALGLDYIKLHPSFVRDIADNAGNQELLKGLCNMARALGIEVIAMGVQTKGDLPLLAQLGFDGATGPGVA